MTAYQKGFREGFLKTAGKAQGATSTIGRLGDWVSKVVSKEGKTGWRSGRKYFGKEWDDVRKLRSNQRKDLISKDPEAANQRRLLLGAGLLGAGALGATYINKNVRNAGGTNPGGPNYPIY
jgi:hypothetical protein